MFDFERWMEWVEISEEPVSLVLFLLDKKGEVANISEL